MSRVVNTRDNKILADDLEIASSFFARLLGLMGRENLPQGAGLLITKSGNSIHTCFMRFAIDAAFISKGEVKHMVSNVKPWRIVVAPVLTFTDCLELPAGCLKKNNVQLGDILRVEN